MNIKKRKIALHSVYLKSLLWKIIAWLQIILQIVIPLFITQPSAASDTPPAIPDSEILTQAATTLTESNSVNISQQIQSGLINQATSQTSASAEQWLSQFGTAQVQLNVDQNGNWDQSSIDLLTPLYDNKSALLFSQFGLRAPDSRVTGNMGLGVRTFYQKSWMFGANFFFDDDFSGNNRRVGIGAEAWTDYLKLSANTYISNTQWHDSQDFDDYQEKPADGFDLRAEGYLPAQPQLGAKVMYEQYYGDKVALFDTDHLQSNPSAITFGVNYTPVPLVTLATDYRRGQDSQDDLQFQLEFHYDFGHDWQYQITPENVALERSLAGSRYDLVERNNQIVMQYRKKEQAGVGKLVLQNLTDQSAADGFSSNQVQVQVLDKENRAMPGRNVQWAASGQAKLDALASVTDEQGYALVNITDTLNEAVNITATSSGISAQTVSHFALVVPATLELSIDKNNSIANGMATDDVTAKVEDSNHRPVANAPIHWSVTSPATLRDSDAVTGADGLAHAHITSQVSGPATLVAGSGALSQQQQLMFVADSQQAVIARFDVTVDKSPANGSAADQAMVVVQDPSGNPVANEPVTVSTDSSTLHFIPAAQRSTSQMHTDARGQVALQFTDAKAETAQLTASLSNGSSKNTRAEFIPDESTAALQNMKVTKDGSPADGHSADTAEVYVKDGNGNPLENQTVTWVTDKPDVQLMPGGGTDRNGRATVSYTRTTAGPLTLTASLPNGTSLSAASSFVADKGSVQIAEYVLTSGAIANGTATNTATVTVTDAQHNALANEPVQWSVEGSAVLASQSGNTDKDGKLTVNLTDTKAESVNVTVTLPANAASQTKQSQFIADSNSATLASVTATQNAVANGVATNSATASVVDANHNALPNMQVHWTVTGSAQLSHTASATDNNGNSTISLTDTVSERVTLTATLDNGQQATANSLFIGDMNAAKVVLNLNQDGSPADGTTANTVEAVVTDGTGNPLPVQTITWSSNSATAQFPATSKTDMQGHSQIAVTSTEGGKVTLTATLANQASSQINTNFASWQVTKLEPDMRQQQADGSAKITFTATLTDNNGALASGRVISFATTGNAQLNSTEATTNAAGQATVTLTDDQAQTVTVTAKSKDYPADRGQTSTVAFIADKFTGILANGQTFSMTDGFPSVGMLYASFTLEINGSTTKNSDYIWSTDASWLRIKTPGVISFTGSTTSGNATANITATPVSGTGKSLTYSFTLKHWILNVANSSPDPTQADTLCGKHSGHVPSYSLYSSAQPGGYGARGIGTLYGEWGDPSVMMGNQWSTSSPAESMWASETGSNGTRIYVNWRNGYVNNRVPSQTMDIVCQIF